MGNCGSHEMGGAQSTAHTAPKSVVVVPASGENGTVRRSVVRHEGELPATFFPGEVTTLYEAFRRGRSKAGDGPCFGYRPATGTTEVTDAAGKTKTETVFGDFRWMSYHAVAEMMDAIGSAVVHLELAKPNDLGHRFIGLYSKNRWEWSTAQQALFTQKVASVPLYDTLGVAAVSYIVRQTGMATIFCSKVETAKLIAFKKADAASFAALTTVLQFEDATDADRAAATEAGLTLRTFSELLTVGRANPKPHNPPAPEDYGVICYTSGTTGDPKGAILTHRNLVADACNAHWGNLGISERDVHLSYLPLAHVFEQLVENALLMVGASIGFYQGDTLKILDDIKALRPTIFPSVPRLFNRIHDKIRGGVETAGGVKASLFNQAFAAKQYWLKQNHITHRFWDGLVFKPLAQRIGLDRCHLMVSGSAPLSSHVMEFLRIVFCCQVVEGYGQTECGGAATVTDPADQASLGHVGGPLASNEIKLVSVPDLGYLVTDTVHGEERDKKTGAVTKAGMPCEGRGEVCYRGPNVFPGYYKDPVNTAAALDAEGWLHSGDIGLWDARGHIKIIDRKKNMFKLSQGEYVASEKIENELLSKWVQQIFVYGDSFHSMLIAIVVPNPDSLRAWADANGKAGVSIEALCADPAVNDMIIKDMAAQGKKRGLQGFEIIKGLHLEPVPWSPDDILTPSFKVKRKDAKERYQEQIDAMYARLDTVAGKGGIKQGAA